MSDYPEEFNGLWRGIQTDNGRSGRKELGYKIYLRTKKKYDIKCHTLEALLIEACEEMKTCPESSMYHVDFLNKPEIKKLLEGVKSE